MIQFFTLYFGRNGTEGKIPRLGNLLRICLLLKHVNFSTSKSFMLIKMNVNIKLKITYEDEDLSSLAIKSLNVRLSSFLDFLFNCFFFLLGVPDSSSSSTS